MGKGGCLVIFMLVLLVPFAFAASVDSKVIDVLNYEDNVSVIVILKENVDAISLDLEERKDAITQKQEEVLDDLNLKDTQGFLGILNNEQDFELEHTYEITNAFSGDVTKEGLEKLQDNPNVEKIVFDRILHPLLKSSVPQINGDDVNALTINGQKITGAGETICIVDTGIDTDHDAFTGRIIGQQCYCGVSDNGAGGCCSDNTTQSSSAEDDQGHGTHVAGIAAGNDSIYRGVAYEAGIVSVKVCDASGYCATSDVISGIEYCTTNAAQYNVSVISMSLGGGGPYNSYCPTDSMATSINAAHVAGINTVVAAGNNGYTTGISSPACIETATPVGAVNSAGSILYNRGDTLDILAPGKSITGPYLGGGRATLSGTSMATPHVSGAIALMRQYWRLAYATVPLPDFIETKIGLTGAVVNDMDNSGKNYSLIDVLALVQPYLSFTSDKSVNVYNRTSVIINVTSDLDLGVALLEWTYLNGTVRNITMLEKNATSYYINMTGLVLNNYTYRVYGNDSINTFGKSAQKMLQIDSDAPSISVVSPLGDSHHSGTVTLNITVSGSDLMSTSMNVTNESGGLVFVNTTDVVDSYIWIDSLSLEEGNYSINIGVNNSIAKTTIEKINFVVDETTPAIFGEEISSTEIYNNDVVTLRVNATDLNLEYVYFESDYNGSLVNYSMVLETGTQYNYTINGGLPELQNVSYKFYALDYAGNENVTEDFTFYVNYNNSNISLVNISAPSNGSILELGAANNFSVDALDPDNNILTYFWDFGDGTNSTLVNVTKEYNSTGTFYVIVNVSDGYGSSLEDEITVVVSDTLAPVTSGISYLSEYHVERDGDFIVNATFFDFTGILNATIYYNELLACGDVNCLWTLSSLADGMQNFVVNVTDNLSNINSTSYDFMVLSCSDGIQNGDEEGLDCGGSCSIVCVSEGVPASSPSSGGSGGGGGGSSAPAAQVAVPPVVSATSAVSDTPAPKVTKPVAREYSEVEKRIFKTVELDNPAISVESTLSEISTFEVETFSILGLAILDTQSKEHVADLEDQVRNKQALPLPIEKIVTVYKVDGEDTLFRSEASLSFTAQEDLEGVTIIEMIPKEVAVSASDIFFENEPVVLEDDPVLQWTFDYVPKGESRTINYVIAKKVEKISTTTVAVASNPQAPNGFSFVSFLISMKWFVIILTGVSVLLSIVYLSKRHPHYDHSEHHEELMGEESH